ncbi:DUF5682 family protein [Desulfococcaceae bacterium HSG9]|nr:DUF5682 family protein [Desulfococcaceae bacterium HSG9]
MTAKFHIFGIRHLSPGGAWHLHRFLDRVKPDIVLIEGLSDAAGLIDHITGRRTKPPIAILAYTQTLPIRTLVYPMAVYSPEYQALLWAKIHDIEARFIDLPSDIFLCLQQCEFSEKAQNPESQSETDTPRVSFYEQFAHKAGEPDYETYWERHFEHNQNAASYRSSAYQLGLGLRNMETAETPASYNFTENIVREAYMRRKIQFAADEGYVKIAAVTGAYHAPVMSMDYPAMTDDELAALPRIESKLTLMPYSYFKLSTQSGYGAGNHAPFYYEMMWRAVQQNDPEKLPAQYLAKIARNLRESGTSRSAAEVIEGLRLANSLAALKGGHIPALCDLKDAAVTLIGQGEKSVVAEAMARVEVGTAIGKLPQGISQTSIQDDFNRELKRLKLIKYKTAVRQDINLDLRENRRVKSEEAAFIDLNRSFFLNRLTALDVPFAEKRTSRQHSATWAEAWSLQWTPESEIAIVEAVLKGETVELAAAFQFKMMIDQCRSVDEAAVIVCKICECGMTDMIDKARRTLRCMAGKSSEFTAVASAADELRMIVRYGDVRRFDTAPLKPLIEQLFTKGALLLLSAAGCDNLAAKKILKGITALNRTALEYDRLIDEALWIRELAKLSDADYLNPMLSGYACAVLLERNLIENEALAREVSRRLSPGIDADLGAGWFEGLAQKNRYALLARLPLWVQLAEYINALDDVQYSRALVFLRRAFSQFSPLEKRGIAENLGEVWGVSSDSVSEVISLPLTEDEEEAIDDLDDFDFDDL